ncbi:MAG TPA: S46 family peptidase [Myxococcaceae bacterium]|nr:S46 family peptidase [Myxococcaceae bacterium]
MTSNRLLTSTLLAGLLSVPGVRAEEGMWTFDNFPSARVQNTYGFSPGQAWLDHVRLSSVRLALGCSGSFVSPNGLVMTNHHCARRCIQDLSTPQQDLTASGFYARTQAEERTCPRMEINQLVGMQDVTARVQGATKGLSGEAFNRAQKAEFARIEKACQTSDQLRCEVVTLYHGGLYQLHTYKRWRKDVRLVFAPEESIAFFGGDPDNFNFPRYDLDVSFVRVYEDGEPLQTPEYFRWSDAGPREGELTFVSGNPGHTSRLLTVAQLASLRDETIPLKLERLAQERGWVAQFAERGTEARRISRDTLFGVENAYKAWFGRRDALTDPVFFASKVKEEQSLRARVAKVPALQKEVGGAWDAIAQATRVEEKLERETTWIRSESKYYSELFGIARNLVWGVAERQKPDTERYREFTDARLPATELVTFSKAPIHSELEVELLTLGLTKMREELGADHPYVHEVLGKESPRQLATRVVQGTKLYDVALRRSLWNGGPAAIAASEDPMIGLVRRLDPEMRAARKAYEDQVESVVRKNSELIAKARFQLEGTRNYPDATFTPRLSYGSVRGWTREDGVQVKPFTDFAGAFTRATGEPPFDLPQSWLKAKDRLTPTTPFDFVTTNDIIGGNSGSPVVNRSAEVVGLVFDGNLPSLGGDYGFDLRNNRTVAVDSRALTEALRVVYGADRLVQELQPAAARTTGPR